LENTMSKLTRLSTLAAVVLVAATLGFSAPKASAQAASAPVAATPVAPAPAAAPAATQELENPYGLKAMIQHGDWVSKGVLILLVIMSMGTWYIMFTKYYEQHKLLKDAKVSNKKFWSAPSVQQGIDGLDKEGAFHFVATEGSAATKPHGGLLEHIDLNTWVGMSIQRAIEEVQNRMQDGLAFLATVGSTAPFIGLFGTVWGILNALTAIGVAGQASIDKVAGPVGEALIMTAIGLAVAVPAVLGYNWLVRRNKVVMEKLRAFGSDLHPVLLGGGSKRG